MNYLESVAVATLGPEGTDSNEQALTLGCPVVLLGTYRAAIEYAKRHKTKLLVPAGFRERYQEGFYSWVDFHFDNINYLELVNVWFDKTLPMVFLHKSYKCIALHPSTIALISGLEDYEEIIYTQSKVEACNLFEQGKVTAAIVSSRMIKKWTDQSCIKARFAPTMVWCLYKVRNT